MDGAVWHITIEKKWHRLALDLHGRAMLFQEESKQQQVLTRADRLGQGILQRRLRFRLFNSARLLALALMIVCVWMVCSACLIQRDGACVSAAWEPHARYSNQDFWPIDQLADLFHSCMQ